ncbi:MAG: glycerophosphodiester phosphodiesterase [Pyrinomonadaceae bacterium]|nr:glycerophosphodiester phosphodiesterase [Pyrinomonadaceae bacterium]
MLKFIFRGISILMLAGAASFTGFYVYLSSFEGRRIGDHEILQNTAGRPLVIAHRGGAGIAPENTLEAFRRSKELGVDMLELDVRATKDGELVVFHDRSVDRTTNGTGLVSEMTFREISKLDAGFDWTNDGGKTFPFRGKGIKVSKLREIFEEFPEIKINIEPKHSEPAPAKPLCDLIREFKREDKVIVASTIHDVLEEFRSECTGVATSASPSEAIGFLARQRSGLSDNYAPEMAVLQTIESIRIIDVVTKNYINAADEMNIKVHVWTVNDVKDMKRLIELGVDGIMTDYPDKLLGIVSSNKKN